MNTSLDEENIESLFFEFIEDCSYSDFFPSSEFKEEETTAIDIADFYSEHFSFKVERVTDKLDESKDRLMKFMKFSNDDEDIDNKNYSQIMELKSEVEEYDARLNEILEFINNYETNEQLRKKISEVGYDFYYSDES